MEGSTTHRRRKQERQHKAAEKRASQLQRKLEQREGSEGNKKGATGESSALSELEMDLPNP